MLKLLYRAQRKTKEYVENTITSYYVAFCFIICDHVISDHMIKKRHLLVQICESIISYIQNKFIKDKISTAF